MKHANYVNLDFTVMELMKSQNFVQKAITAHPKLNTWLNTHAQLAHILTKKVKPGNSTAKYALISTTVQRDQLFHLYVHQEIFALIKVRKNIISFLVQLEHSIKIQVKLNVILALKDLIVQQVLPILSSVLQVHIMT